MKIRSIISIILSISYILFNILILWATLGWNVRKARKAFEKQLIRNGMAKKDAQRISAQYSKLKNDVMNTLKRSMRGGI
jgi:type VI protein secretion system component VasK